MSKNKQIQTKKNEERFFTSDPGKMSGKYVAVDLCKKWIEDFVDEDSGEVVSINRYELLINAGELIVGDILAKIQFYIQSKEIEGVEVSNQRRVACLIENNTHMTPWSVTARMGKKNMRLLLYATTPYTALEIAKDYIELNSTDNFCFTNVKTFDYCIFIKNILTKSADEEKGNKAEQSFYKIDVEVNVNDNCMTYTFVLQSKDVDTAMVLVNDWIAKTIKEQNKNNDEVPDFSTVLKSGVVIPCNRIIEREFSEAYVAGEDNYTL